MANGRHITFITSTPFGKADGLVNVEIAGGFQPAGFKASDGKLWFPSQDGVAQNWVEAGTRRTAYYSHVPPGEYAFKVIAANSDGLWDSEGKSMQVVVLPPFHRTWWFMTLASLSVAGIVLLAARGENFISPQLSTFLFNRGRRAAGFAGQNPSVKD